MSGAALEHDAVSRAPQGEGEVGESRRAGERVHVREIRGDEEIGMPAAPGEGDAPHAHARTLEEGAHRIPRDGGVGVLRIAEPLEGRPERGPAGDVDGSRPVYAQPELVLVLVGQAPARARRQQHDEGEAEGHARRL
jgi:hypothetical protein